MSYWSNPTKVKYFLIGGRKYDENGEIKERTIDQEKAESAAIFEEKWKIVREDEDYLKLKKEHQKKYG